MITDTRRWDAIHRKLYDEEEWHSQYADQKEKLFKRGSIVVDLGGGTGADALYFLQQGHSVVLLDISEFALKVALDKAKKRSLDDRLVTRQVDFGLHEMPLKDSSVDVAYSRISLNYFPRDQTLKIFTDIYRILKPGAKAYLTFKSPDDVVEMEYLEKTAVVYEPGVFIQNGQLRSRFTKEELSEIVNMSKIKSFSVTPYIEDLSKKSDDHHPSLHLNEVVIVKE